MRSSIAACALLALAATALPVHGADLSVVQKLPKPVAGGVP